MSNRVPCQHPDRCGVQFHISGSKQETDCKNIGSRSGIIKSPFAKRVPGVRSNGSESRPIRSIDEAETSIQRMEPFHSRKDMYGAVSFSGSFEDTSFPIVSGRLPAEDREVFDSDRMSASSSGSPFYVVKSRATPIGWVYTDEEGETRYRVPDAQYSTSTSRQQSIVRKAFAAMAEG